MVVSDQSHTDYQKKKDKDLQLTGGEFWTEFNKITLNNLLIKRGAIYNYETNSTIN